MAKTIEQLNQMYEGREEDHNYLEMQARIGSEEDAAKAYDENGEFHCIHWFDCQFCPAFRAEHCL